MSYKGWLILAVISIALIYGGIFFLRTIVPTLDETPHYDIESEGIPKFINTDFVELDKIECIKRFRSGFGSDNSDIFEDCREMNNLFYAFNEYRVEKELKIFSPINGTIMGIYQIESNVSGTWQGVEEDLFTIIWIQSHEYPAFTIRLGWLDIRDMGVKYGTRLSAGQHIGYGCMKYNGKVTGAPVVEASISINTLNGVKKVSYFDVITDDVFQNYKNRGVPSRDDFIISKEERDAHPLNCIDETKGPETDWIYEKGDIPNFVYLGKDPDNFDIITDYN